MRFVLVSMGMAMTAFCLMSAPVQAAQPPVAGSGTGPEAPDTVELDSSGTGPIDEEPPLAVVALQDELFLGSVLITAWGLHFWHWFEQPMHFETENGFSSRSSTGGADKLGHFLTSYVFSDFLSWRLSAAGFTPMRSAVFGAMSALALMTWIEIGDGTSAYGFSLEDLLADFLGVLVSVGRQLVPHAAELIDLRVQYWPTSEYFDSGEVVADYSGMKFLLALQVAGMGPLRRSPLRFVELHFGYYSRGYRTFDENQDNASRHLYFGLALSLKELLRPVLPEVVNKPVSAVLSYYQLPWVAAEIKDWKL